ncbi:hypothetical protein pb186bvf_016386 [Paramecium bursaria]
MIKTKPFIKRLISQQILNYYVLSKLCQQILQQNQNQQVNTILQIFENGTNYEQQIDGDGDAEGSSFIIYFIIFYNILQYFIIFYVNSKNSSRFIIFINSISKIKYIVQNLDYLNKQQKKQMINPILLTFRSSTLEMEYRQSIKHYVEQQFLAYILQILLITILVILQILDLQQQSFIILGCVTIAILLVSLILIKRNINWSAFVNSVLQILIAIIFNLGALFLKKTVIDQELQWFFGFICAFCHITLLNQGFQVFPQIISIFAGLTMYLAQLDYNNVQSRYTCVIFTIIFISMSIMRYLREKQTRNQYLEFKECQKWEKIVQIQSKQVTMLVKMDYKQDQIKLQNHSKKINKFFPIKSNEEFRQLFRSISVERKQQLLSISKPRQGYQQKQSLETVVRKLLTQSYQEKDIIQMMTKQIYSQYLGYKKDDNKYFKIHLVDYFKENQRCVLVIIQKHNQNKITLLQQNQLLEKLYSKISSKLFLTINHLMQMDNRQYDEQSILQYNYCCLANIWMNSKKFMGPKLLELFRVQDLLEDIKRFSRYKVEFINECDNQLIRNSKSALILICYNLVNYFFQITNQKTIINVSQSYINGKIIYCFTLMTNFKSIPNVIRLFLEENQYYYGLSGFRKKPQDIRKNIQILSSNVLRLKDYIGGKDSLLQCLGLTITKYLLLHFGMDSNKFQYN